MIKTFSTPTGRVIYRTLRMVPGSTKMGAGRKTVRVRRVLNDQAKVIAKNPVSSVLGTAVPIPGATSVAANTLGRYVESPVLARVAPSYSRGVDKFVNRVI